MGSIQINLNEARAWTTTVTGITDTNFTRSQNINALSATFASIPDGEYIVAACCPNTDQCDYENVTVGCLDSGAYTVTANCQGESEYLTIQGIGTDAFHSKIQIFKNGQLIFSTTSYSGKEFIRSMGGVKIVVGKESELSGVTAHIKYDFDWAAHVGSELKVQFTPKFTSCNCLREYTVQLNNCAPVVGPQPTFSTTVTQPVCDGTNLTQATVTWGSIANGNRVAVCQSSPYNCANDCSNALAFSGSSQGITLTAPPPGQSATYTTRMYNYNGVNCQTSPYTDDVFVITSPTCVGEVTYPSATVTVEQPICESGVLSNPKIVIANIQNADRIRYCWSATYACNNTDCDPGDVQISNGSAVITLAAPPQGQARQVTVRLYNYNGTSCADSPYNDYTVTVTSPNCAPISGGACEIDITNNGKYQVYEKSIVHTGGSGTLYYALYAYTVPDKLEIFQNNVKVVERRCLGGYVRGSISINPGDSLVIRINGECSGDTTTIWKFKASCAGQPIFTDGPHVEYVSCVVDCANKTITAKGSAGSETIGYRLYRKGNSSTVLQYNFTGVFTNVANGEYLVNMAAHNYSPTGIGEITMNC